MPASAIRRAAITTCSGIIDECIMTRHKTLNRTQLEMWANAQRDGRPAEYRWRPLFNAAKFG